MKTDVVVVGGGITGLTSAYLLTAAGKSVVVVERRRLAAIDTGHTSAHLTMVLDTRLTDMVKSFGRDHAQAAWDAGLAALAQVDAIVRDEDIPCHFAWVPAYLHMPAGVASEPQAAAMKEETDLAVSLGFDASWIQDVPLVGGPGIRFDNQARFHPREYLAGLARAISANGGHIYEHTEATDFLTKPLRVRAGDFTITCGDVVLATHVPLLGISNTVSAALFQTKLALYTSYVVAGHVDRTVVPDALFWDTGDPYHYLRLDQRRDHDVVLFGGEDHKTGQVTDTAACYERLERRLKALVPSITMTERWSGQVVETSDGLPYIGSSAEHQFAATGFSGNGMTFGTLSAMMACDAILGRSNPWTDLFDTGRTKIRGGLWDYLKENKDYPYYLIRDRFAGPEGRNLRSVSRGSGKILDLNGSRVAAFRDDGGRTVVRSAVCTHMGCEVAWNQAERTWDCPCHGSRFTTTGDVLAGPAESALPKVDPDA